jgi:polyferredoxin
MYQSDIWRIKMKRQKIRQLLLLISLLLFPITLYYFSPALIIQGAMEGIISGSFITFALMFFLSILLGRSFCGYLCPAGAIQEATFGFSDKKAKLGKRKYIKYVIWVIWITFIILGFCLHGRIEKADALYMTVHGISVTDIHSIIIYYFVVCMLFIPSLIWGKRAACHYICWMAPFMVIGTKIRNKLHLPGLHIAAEKDKCISCNQCSKKCPMSLDVEAMVQKGRCNDSECILCGACVDTCPKAALHYQFKREKTK